MNVGAFDLGAGWVSSKGFWLKLFAALVRDFEVGENYLNTEISLGMVFSKSWGASVEYIDSDYFIPGTTPGVGGRIDHQAVISLHYNF